MKHCYYFTLNLSLLKVIAPLLNVNDLKCSYCKISNINNVNLHPPKTVKYLVITKKEMREKENVFSYQEKEITVNNSLKQAPHVSESSVYKKNKLIK